ncbi:MAG: LysR substrate-binding domain-containing protein [Brachymonas sp.]|nr:LysR substrate-binding domain-containing protein [Brachymonas sp.]
MKNTTLRQLRVFSEAARQQSFAQAAASLHLTPPAISMQIKELEEQVGLPLFERSGRKVQLTAAGEYVLVYARRILAAVKEADDAVARLREVEAGQLVIGMVSTAQYFLPMMLAQFRAEHPGVDIKLAVGNRASLVELLKAGELDIAVMGRPPKELATSAEPFAKQPHVFVGQPAHPLVAQGRRARLAPQRLAGHPFIMRESGSGTRASLENFCAETGLAPQVVMEMSSNETIKQAVMAGMGLSFLSLHTIGTELRHQLLAVVRVKGCPVMRDWHCVHTLERVLSPAAEAFRQFMLQRGEAFLEQEFGHLLGP